MNGNAFTRISIVVFAMILGLYVVLQVLTGYRNNLSELFRLMGYAGFILGFIQPKLSIYLLVPVCGFLDLLKRFQLAFGRVSMDDIIAVLSLSPILFAGICCGVIFGRLQRGMLFTSREWKLVWVAVLIVGTILASATFKTGSLRGGLTIGANAGAYVPLIFIAGILFRGFENQEKYLRWIVVVFLPVAIYGAKQGIFGLSHFETEYLESGLTVIGNLTTQTLMRPFSTLSSPHAFSVVMVAMFGISFFLGRHGTKARGFFLFLSVVFLATTFVGSVTRTAWAMIAMILMGMLFFKGKQSTLLLYAGMAVMFVITVVSSSFFIENLGEWHETVTNSAGNDWTKRVGQIGTMTERFVGMESWSRSGDLWSWFGIDERTIPDKMRPHDLIGQILLSRGAVGLAGIVLMGVIGLTLAHRSVLRIEDPKVKRLGVAYLSIIFAFIASGMFAGNHTAVFPLNFFFWLFIGLLFSIIREAKVVKAPKTQSVPLSVQRGMEKGMIPPPSGRIMPTGRVSGEASSIPQ